MEKKGKGDFSTVFPQEGFLKGKKIKSYLTGRGN